MVFSNVPSTSGMRKTYLILIQIDGGANPVVSIRSNADGENRWSKITSSVITMLRACFTGNVDAGNVQRVLRETSAATDSDDSIALGSSCSNVAIGFSQGRVC